MSKEIFSKASEILADAKIQLNNLLTLPDYSHPLLSANHQLDHLINRFNFLSGAPEAAKEKKTFPPVTNFMGKEIKHAKKINSKELSPDQATKEYYKDKVAKLYAEFISLDPDTVLNSYKTKDDELVLRGVAKKAGLADFLDAELTILYLESIQEAIKEQATDAAKEKEIDKKLQKAAAVPDAAKKVPGKSTPLKKSAVPSLPAK